MNVETVALLLYIVPLVFSIVTTIVSIKIRRFAEFTEIDTYGDVCAALLIGVIPVLNLVLIIAFFCVLLERTNILTRKIHKELR